MIPEPENPIAWNRYAYVYNSPLNYTDPSGHSALGLALGALAVVDAVSDGGDFLGYAMDCFGDNSSIACYAMAGAGLMTAIPGDGPGDNMVLYHGLPDGRLKKHTIGGLQISSIEGYRGAGLYTTPSLDEAILWTTRHGESKYSVLRFEVDSGAWQSLRGKAVGMTDYSETYRTMAESIILAQHPGLISGLPRSQVEFAALIDEVFPGLNKSVGPIHALDYLHGEVPLPNGSFGYEYVFKSYYAIQDLLNNPLKTKISVTDSSLKKWKPISFPRR